ncbi:MAG: LON peptidase substrate-binding domain-containing protein [Ignavibacteria bacterium]|nr:LON peptidase substrate-binding domain-containing protein [Ignavibacteria bacterium]
MSGEPLPLFPLQVVLFPNSALSLHIFEERYKVLINECVSDNKELGIILVNESKMSEIGCTATVKDVLQKYEDGRLDIVVQGGRRYKLYRYDYDLAPYTVGFVQYLENSDEPVDPPLAQETIELFNKLVSVVYRQKFEPVPLDIRSDDLSFLLAQKAGMSLNQRQGLLELVSENKRLQMLRGYFVDVIPKLAQLEEVERIIRSDGYV